ncbi:ABC transporter substrate-binding protein [Geobacillus thermocatenulatus]|uniref:ABC transporter substrate-binding protein n=1 Tax=Geobacillus thermocatenulatus TaxID=33938 RepID=A0A226Q4Q2_9BACL|nr:MULTISPECIES: ABC transporter substrate-binding protein [Geobacillus]AST00533.1 ABC transporter substrate-binding protein [Geobacillus thermocatenulatus]KLR75239.1 peptide ABC transporter substrate-binding protein [Geobacillus sp. T6]OXB86914.1 ABC transporter substrate-binding protein [Geobacillus thermocatenulatus]RAN30327.1 peptide ABC transporter substrate-binding protein [Geobacillus sp. A8]
MKRKTWFTWLALMLAVMLVLAGCGKSKQTAGGGGDKSSTQDTLVYGRGGDSVSLDPATVTDGESLKVTKNIFDTLLDYNDNDTSIKPALATEWTISNDGLTYTFKLRQGVKFHDGTEFNADAVVFNFERWANGNADKFPYYGSMFGGYKQDDSHVIKEVKALDKYTVQFVLKRPQAPFLKNLAMTPFAIASPEAVKKYGDKFGEHPVGTGPFVFKEWKRNERIVLEKNKDYWEKGYPKLNQLIFVSIPDNSARLNALLKGEIDIMEDLNPTDLKQVEGNKEFQIFKRPSMNVAYVGLTATRGPLKNKLVRQALNYAVDKKAIIDAFYAGQAEPAKNPMPPSIPGYNDAIQDYPFDLNKAKELLAKAGYPNGFEIELWAMPVPRPYMPDGQKIAEAIQANFAKIGVKAKIVTYEWATYLDKLAKGEADAFLLGWTGDNGDADNFLYALLDKDSIGSNNYTYFSNDELHDILVEAQTVSDENKRNELYKKAQEIIKEEAPWIPLVHSTPLLAGKANIQGFHPHPTGSDKFTKVEFR